MPRRFIETNLKMAFPDVRIVGEEGDLGAVDPEDEAVMKELASIRPDLSCLNNKWKDAADLLLPAKDLCVWIDPLDGTREFTEGRFNYVSTLGAMNSPSTIFPHEKEVLHCPARKMP